LSQKKIGELFGLSQQTVSDAIADNPTLPVSGKIGKRHIPKTKPWKYIPPTYTIIISEEKSSSAYGSPLDSIINHVEYIVDALNQIVYEGEFTPEGEDGDVS